MVVSHLILAGCIEAMKTGLSTVYTVVALDCKRYSKQYLDHRKYVNWKHTTHLGACCG